jgi:hypothetical protein
MMRRLHEVVKPGAKMAIWLPATMVNAVLESRRAGRR